MPFCAGTRVRACLCGIRKSVPCLTRNFSLLPASSAECFPEVFRHLIDETMNGSLRDAMPGNRVHRPSQRAEGWLVKATKIQLRFGAGQWIHGKVSFHEREETWSSRSFPFEL